MSRGVMSVGRAQFLLGRLVGIAVALTLCFALLSALEAIGSYAADLLLVLLLCMAPPAAVLGLLFAGQRRLAGYVSLLGTVPCIALFLLALIPLGASGIPVSRWIGNIGLSLPFLYSAITLARVGVGFE